MRCGCVFVRWQGVQVQVEGMCFAVHRDETLGQQFRDDRGDAHGRRATRPMGIGPVGGVKQFKSGAQFGAWLGLASKQQASDGRSDLG